MSSTVVKHELTLHLHSLDTSELARFMDGMRQSVGTKMDLSDLRGRVLQAMQARGVWAAVCIAWGASRDTIEMVILESLFKGIYVPFNREYSFGDCAVTMGLTVATGLADRAQGR